MKFIGIKKVFSTKNNEQYQTIGDFWDQNAVLYGRCNLIGLGCNWTNDSIDYVIALKEGMIPGANFEIDLPENWIEVSGNVDDLSNIYDKIYQSGPLLYEIEEFDDEGNCWIRYCR